MIRLFERHNVREYRELDGMWSFVSEKYPSKCYTLPVPSAWEQHPDLLNYRGKGTYTRKVLVKRDSNIRLVFKGVSHTADVFFDGEKIVHHYNAYTPFTAIVKNVKQGEHTISVDVDNTFSEASALHIPNDYYTYGGLTRPVAMEYVGDVYVENIHFTPIFRDGKWYGKTEIKVTNLTDKAELVTVKASLSDQSIAFENVKVEPDSVTVFTDEREYPGVATWKCEAPRLYYLTATIEKDGILTDDLIDRVGFRKIEVVGKDIVLNGERFFIKGFNRHEDYATVGCAIPLQLMIKDIELMIDAGANSVRTCHYPNDEIFLDLCDEKGLVVWEENHARGLSLPDMQNPNFERQCKDCIDEMIEYHYNHPAIIIWGILNECASDTKEGREMYKKQYEQIRSLDTSRPLTSASCQFYRDICLDMPDIVSFNLYSGWYNTNQVDVEFEKQYAWIQTSGGAGKPMIISEFGGAAIYGFRDPTRVKWSEERQADIIDESLECYMNTPDVCGVYIWQFADCRVTEEGKWYQTRARTRNNKGIVDEYRRPKLSFEIVKKHFKK